MALRGKITHCIFDMDGLLLDTEVFYTVAQDKVFEDFKECGYQERKQELKGMMMGRKSQDAARLVLRELGLEDEMTPDEFLERRAKILRGLLPQAKLLPGALRLLEHLRDSGVPCALATSSNRPQPRGKARPSRSAFTLPRCSSPLNFIRMMDGITILTIRSTNGRGW